MTHYCIVRAVGKCPIVFESQPFHTKQDFVSWVMLRVVEPEVGHLCDYDTLEFEFIWSK